MKYPNISNSEIYFSAFKINGNNIWKNYLSVVEFQIGDCADELEIVSIDESNSLIS